MIECVGQSGLVEWTSSKWLFVFLEIKRVRFIAKETIVTSKHNQIGPRKASRTSIGQSGGKDKEYALRSGFAQLQGRFPCFAIIVGQDML
jgi:hypothetical protein